MHKSGKNKFAFEIKLSCAVETPVRYEALQQYFPPRGPGNPQLLEQKDVPRVLAQARLLEL